MSTCVESFSKLLRSEEEPLLSRQYFKEPEFEEFIPLQTAHRASHFLPSSQVKIETLKNPITPKPALTQAVADAADDSWYDKGKVISYEFLEDLTNNFSSDNYMGRTQYGMLYKGFVPDGCKQMRSGEVTVKMWKNERFYSEDQIVPRPPYFTMSVMEHELKFLLQPDIAVRSDTVNVLGYCFEENKLGVVYDVKPLQTLDKYIDNDKFGWRDRVNVAVKLAYLLKFFHENEPRYIVQNLSPAHVMLDQDLNPVLIDYASIQCGPFEDMKAGVSVGSFGYYYAEEHMVGPHTPCTDVYTYGIILLEMLRQCSFNSGYVKKYSKTAWIDDFAWVDYTRYKAAQANSGGLMGPYSLAVKCLRDDPAYNANDGEKISLLALKCVEKWHIPTIDEVIRGLKEVWLVQRMLLLLD